MFESSLLTKLKSDNTLCSFVSTFNNVPAIFAENAPINADLPYVIFNIDSSSDLCPAVQKFSISIDFFAYDKSAVDGRKASERIEFLLDRLELQHERFQTIRVFFFAKSKIPDSDPRVIHYNLSFSARAGRKKWINQLA